MTLKLNKCLSKVGLCCEDLKEAQTKMDKVYIELGILEPALIKWVFKSNIDNLPPASKEFRENYKTLEEWGMNKKSLMKEDLQKVKEVICYAILVKYKKPAIIKEYELQSSPYVAGGI